MPAYQLLEKGIFLLLRSAAFSDMSVMGKPLMGCLSRSMWKGRRRANAVFSTCFRVPRERERQLAAR
jgi:hypothetical protein